MTGNPPTEEASPRIPGDLVEKAAIMREFSRRRAAGESISDQLRASHMQATNDGYATGPERGERIPGFSLPDQYGELRRLASLCGRYGLLLVFHRSADWCRYCRSQLVELERSRPMLEQNGLRIAAISYDSREALSGFAERFRIGYPLLSDHDSATIRAFGVFNWNFAPGLRSYGAAHPVTYLVAPDGVVVRKYFVPNYLHRVSGSAMALQEFGVIAGNASSVALNHSALSAQIRLAADWAFPGQEVGFMVKFDLVQGWHVYGAGSPEPYTATSVVIDHPSIVHQTFELPDPKMQTMAGETVPVHSDTFQAVGSLRLKFELDPGPLLLQGRLTFQRCSDAVCEAPETIPFELSLTIDPLVVAEK